MWKYVEFVITLQLLLYGRKGTAQVASYEKTYPEYGIKQYEFAFQWFLGQDFSALTFYMYNWYD